MIPTHLLFLVLTLVITIRGQVTNCKVSIVGGGWGGIYFAWRVTVDTNKFKAEDVCIFEASTIRTGGRVYSVGGIAELHDLVVDVGAYRYNTSHVIIKSLIEQVLQLPTTCYDPSDCSYRIVKDIYGNNAGFNKPMQTMLAQFQLMGGRLPYMGYWVNRIAAGSGRRSILFFKNGEFVQSDFVFFNVPPSEIMSFDPSSIIFTKASPDVVYYLKCPLEVFIVKVYIVYKDAWWLTILGKTTGTFNMTTNPPILGRYHDGPVKCKTDTGWATERIPFQDDCEGALLVYYGIDVSYYAQFKESVDSPLTIVRPGNDKYGQLLTDIHASLMNYHWSQFIDRGVDPDSIPPPQLGLIGHWDKSFDTRYPGIYYLSESDLDATRAVLFPVANHDICVGNQGYTDGAADGGWAEPSVIMAERCAYHHVNLKQPTWIPSSYYNSRIIEQHYYNNTFSDILEEDVVLVR